MRLGILAIFLTAAAAAPAAHAEFDCEEYKGADAIQLIEPNYKLIAPLDYRITSGSFLGLCAEQDHLWYMIKLDTQQPGKLTVTIPKDSLDLRQYDYETCSVTTYYASYLKNNHVVSVQQISQTDTYRILEFIYTEPVSQIEYFGVNYVADGRSSEPNQCIKSVESGVQPAEINKINYVYTSCTIQVKYNYEISDGKIEKICHNSDNGKAVIISLKDAKLHGRLSVDIPYADLPLLNKETFQGFFILLDGHPMESYLLEHDILLQTTTRHANYQTFNIDLIPNTKYIELLYAYSDATHGGDPGFYSCKSDLISILKHDRSDLVCVTPATAETLVERGWALPF